MASAMAGTLDEAYERLHVTGPEFEGYLSNHGPMVVEAMVRGGHGDLGPVDIHRSHIVVPTKNSMDANESAVFSYRVAMRRKCLILLMNRSTKLRSW